jgi:DNA-binding MarR family transcriptional regulator
MEAKGLVVRVRAVDDRRQVLCTISQAGTELLARLDAPMNQADNDAIRSLEHDEQLALLAMLDKIRADLTP